MRSPDIPSCAGFPSPSTMPIQARRLPSATAFLSEDSGARLPGRTNALLPVQDIAWDGDRVCLSDSDAIYHCAVELLTGRLSGCESAGVRDRSGLNGMALRQGG